MSIQLKRAYDDPGGTDGYRILVDRLWPRGKSREDLQLDDWYKKAAPSDKLRRWFDHDPDKFDAFRKRYTAELDQKPDIIDNLLQKARSNDKVTLVYAAKDRDHNNAVVLREYLENRL